MSRLERIERVSLAVAIAAVLAALAAAWPGQTVIPSISAAWAWIPGALLLAVGALAGVASRLRAAEIDRQRWELVNDPYTTSEVRKTAHREAERRRQTAGTILLLGPLVLGFLLSQRLEPRDGLAPLAVSVAPVAGFFVGLLLGRRPEAPHP
jgi:hypothetical protein